MVAVQQVAMAVAVVMVVWGTLVPVVVLAVLEVLAVREREPVLLRVWLLWQP